MECEQLIRLIKDWYLRVKQETMAPARMMQFMDQHVKRCPICQRDLLLPDEVEKIREFVFPEALLLKTGHTGDRSTPEISSDETLLDDDDRFVDDPEEDAGGDEDEGVDEALDEDDLDDDDMDKDLDEILPVKDL